MFDRCESLEKWVNNDYRGDFWVKGTGMESSHLVSNHLKLVQRAQGFVLPSLIVLNVEGMEATESPSCSDLNPTENLWDTIGTSNGAKQHHRLMIQV